MISPAVSCLTRLASLAVPAMDSLTGEMPGGHGCPPRAGTGASPRGICRSASLTSSPAGMLPAWSSPWSDAGRVMLPVSVPRMAAARSWARADRAVCRQIPSQVRAWLRSQPYTSFPVLKVFPY